MRSARSLVIAALALLLSPAAQAAEPAITPRPRLVVEAPGAPVRLGDGTPVLASSGDAEAAGVARYLADLARRSGGPRLEPGTVPVRPPTRPTIRFVRRAGFAAEGYALDVGDAGATITSSGRAGLFYGAVSLWQLLTAAPDRRLAPIHIEDAPRFSWRGMMLDSARHVQSAAAIARMLDWMAVHKLNRLEWHLADDQGWRLQIMRYPRLTSIGAWRTSPPAIGSAPGRYGGFYTQAQVRRLVALAAARNITIVPEIEMPGHATAAILAYPKVGLTTMTPANLGDWGVFPSIYVVDEASFSFLHGVLDEVMALFPSHEIAIGGDEAVHTLWHGSPAVQARMQALGLKDETALQAWFIRKIGAYLNAHGRRLVGWDEILADGALPTQDIVLSWHGADGALAAARAGHDVVMATAPTLYFDNRQAAAPSEPPGRGLVVGLHDVYDYDPANPPHLPGTAPLNASAVSHVLGVQAQLWTEHITTDARLEGMALPRAAALAEIGWTVKDRLDWPGFVARVPAMFARYQALGLSADDGALAVEAQVTREGGRTQVSLGRQLDVGDIRYTTGGTAATVTSPRYEGAFEVRLPGRVRAASFFGPHRLSRELDLRLDAVSVTRRTSQQLEPCGHTTLLNLEGHAGGGETTAPVYLVAIKDPCWIYRGAALTGVGHVAVAVAALPFNFQLADEPPVKLPQTATPAGELVIRPGCDGAVLATIPLAGAGRGGAANELVTPIPPQTGPADLCLILARPRLDPLWALGWVELRP